MLHGVISQKTVFSPSRQNNLQSPDTPRMDFRFGLDSAHRHIGQPTKLAKFRILHPSARKRVNLIDVSSRYVTAPFRRHKLRSVQWAWNVFTDGVYVAICGIRLSLGICLQIQRRITTKPVRIAVKSTEIRTGQPVQQWLISNSIESYPDTHWTRCTASLDNHSGRTSHRTYSIVLHFTRSVGSSQTAVSTETQSLTTHINNSSTDNESAMSARGTHFN